MTHTENFMKKCGIKWRSFGTLTQIAETLDWEKIEKSTRSYERRGFGSRMVHHPNFVLAEILEHGYINIDNKEQAKKSFDLGPVFEVFPEELCQLPPLKSLRILK